MQRKLKIKNLTTGNEFQVAHYHIDQWIDKTAIGSDQYPLLIDLLKIFYFEASNYNGHTPVVHCSAGIGRTGVFSACFLLYCQFKKC